MDSLTALQTSTPYNRLRISMIMEEKALKKDGSKGRYSTAKKERKPSYDVTYENGTQVRKFVK